MPNLHACFVAGISAYKSAGFLAINQKELAEKIGYTETHISQVFRGRRKASQELQERIAQEFGLAVDTRIPRALALGVCQLNARYKHDDADFVALKIQTFLRNRRAESFLACQFNHSCLSGIPCEFILRNFFPTM